MWGIGDNGKLLISLGFLDSQYWKWLAWMMLVRDCLDVVSIPDFN